MLAHCHNIADLRVLAQKRLPAPLFHFLEGGAEDELTAQRNIAAFDDVSLLPHYLVGVDEVETSTTVLGQKINWPIILAPTGGSRLFYHLGERAVARAAAQAGILYTLACFSSVSIEDVANCSEGPRMFQLLPFRDKGLTRELIQRCRAAGYSALCLTVDCPTGGNRERDVRYGMNLRPPSFTIKNKLGIAMHPSWLWHYVITPRIGPANFTDVVKKFGADNKAVTEYIRDLSDPGATWEVAVKMIEQWGGPFAIKGILGVEDARRAVDIGASAVIVSNHGGRQLDGAVATIDVLPEIADAVGDQCEVILDSGVRRGTHVLKALALGAKACMVGRPYLYGLAAGGEAGVDHALGIFRSEIERDMALMGCRRVADLGKEHVRMCR